MQMLIFIFKPRFAKNKFGDNKDENSNSGANKLLEINKNLQ